LTELYSDKHKTGGLTEINKIRYLIERAIANLKTWRVLHLDYRRPLASFAEQSPPSLP
jgi:hypothetical protein